MKITKISLAAIMLTVAVAGCKPKDADIQAAVQQKEAAGVNVTVQEGVVTLDGTVTDEAAKAKAEEMAKGEKGVKSITNNLTVPVMPAPASMPSMPADDAVSSGVRDAVKDFPTVNASVANGVVMLTGSIKKDKLPKLMMAISALKPKKIDNKLTTN